MCIIPYDDEDERLTVFSSIVLLLLGYVLKIAGIIAIIVFFFWKSVPLLFVSLLLLFISYEIRKKVLVHRSEEDYLQKLGAIYMVFFAFVLFLCNVYNIPAILFYIFSLLVIAGLFAYLHGESTYFR